MSFCPACIQEYRPVTVIIRHIGHFHTALFDCIHHPIKPKRVIRHDKYDNHIAKVIVVTARSEIGCVNLVMVEPCPFGKCCNILCIIILVRFNIEYLAFLLIKVDIHSDTMPLRVVPNKKLLCDYIKLTNLTVQYAAQDVA